MAVVKRRRRSNAKVYFEHFEDFKPRISSLIASGSGGAMIGGLFGVVGAVVGAAVGATAAYVADTRSER